MCFIPFFQFANLIRWQQNQRKYLFLDTSNKKCVKWNCTRKTIICRNNILQFISTLETEIHYTEDCIMYIYKIWTTFSNVFRTSIYISERNIKITIMHFQVHYLCLLYMWHSTSLLSVLILSWIKIGIITCTCQFLLCFELQL